MNGASISFRGIEKRYASVQAVDQVSLDVRPGEFVSLLGPSGSGKTTLLMMIAGFELPTGGRILIGDRDMTYVAPNRRGIGMVFQRYALFPHMTVAENIAFPLRMRKVDTKSIRNRVANALALVQLENYGQRMPSELSGGQQQRVAVARALVFEPPVLLMDEPLGALDKKLREQMQIEIKSLQQRLGVTVIYVTHDQEEALTMSDRIAVMRSGRLEQVGTPTDLYDRPATPFVADFIGKTNFLDGRCTVRGSGECDLELNGGEIIRLPQRRTIKAAAAEHIRIAVRPELIKLVPPAPSSPLGGVVENVIFVGSFRTFLVRLSAGELVHIQSPAGIDAWQPVEGDAVALSIPHGAFHLFSDARA